MAEIPPIENTVREFSADIAAAQRRLRKALTSKDTAEIEAASEALYRTANAAAEQVHDFLDTLKTRIADDLR